MLPGSRWRMKIVCQFTISPTRYLLAPRLKKWRLPKPVRWSGSIRTAWSSNHRRCSTLNPAYEAAFRPVHIQNVGSLAAEPMDEFWETIYRTIGIEAYALHSPVLCRCPNAAPLFQYTSILQSTRPKGVLRLWLEYFKVLVADQQFQSGACSSELHQIFLHQAILSTLVAKLLPLERIRLLPSEYSYPLHLHHKVPPAHRAVASERSGLRGV